MIPDGPARADAISIGEAAATAILVMRASDGALVANIPYVPVTEPGLATNTKPEPAGSVQRWPWRRACAASGLGQFRPDGPPALSSRRYARDYNEVKGAGQRFSAVRTAEQSEIARFWCKGSIPLRRPQRSLQSPGAACTPGEQNVGFMPRSLVLPRRDLMQSTKESDRRLAAIDLIPRPWLELGGHTFGVLDRCDLGRRRRLAYPNAFENPMK
jgi:hypothetical protein